MEIFSKSRQQAEVAFDKARSRSLSLTRTLDEMDSVTKAREEKTFRLRQARLAKEEVELEAVPKAKRSKRPKIG